MALQTSRYFVDAESSVTHYSVEDLKNEAIACLKKPDNYCREGKGHCLKLRDYGIIVGNTHSWGDLWVVGECKMHNYQVTHHIAI